jgi:pimeloyl-ACP methyl ester carboxylesterase
MTTDAILLIHGGVFSDWFVPVAARPELHDFRVVRVRRAGYDSAVSGHLTLADHAAYCARVLDELEIPSAHICGHSSGALIALELALARPDAVQSLVLLEPAPMSALVGPQCQAALPAAIGPVMAAVAAGDIASAFDLFLRAVGRHDHREVLDAALGPDAYERALQEAAFFFGDEVPAAMEWTFGPDEAARIQQPMLVVEGGETAAVSVIPPESVRLLAELVPHAETRVLPGASHLMPLENPEGVARLVAEFARRHERRSHS